MQGPVEAKKLVGLPCPFSIAQKDNRK